MIIQENVEFDNGKNEGDEITSFAEEEVGLKIIRKNHQNNQVKSETLRVGAAARCSGGRHPD